MNRKKGFTLIELMIVIAIISILASIIIPNIARARARAQLTACMENIKSIYISMTMYEADHPINDFDWHEVLSTSPLYPDYIATIPTCPASGDIYSAHFHPHRAKGVFCQGGGHTQIIAHLIETSTDPGPCACNGGCVSYCEKSCETCDPRMSGWLPSVLQ
ncbi:MAG: type II secretion system protein [Vulcanimicrobiota bacterium]